MGKLTGVLVGLMLALPGLAEEDKLLNVYNWVDYIGPDTIKIFEARTGIKVTYDVFDSNDVLQGKLLAGSSGFDIVVPTSGYHARMLQAGAFQRLDHTKLPNLKHMDPVLMKQLERFDAGNQYGIPYLWGTTGLGINRQLVTEMLGEDAPVDSWALVFEPGNLEKLKACGVSFLDAYDELFPAVLAYQGLDPTAQDAELFKTAVVPVLAAVGPHVTYFHSSKYINDLANGDICVALGWSGDILQAGRRASEANLPFTIEYHMPQEGTVLWFDMLAIPVDAPHPENALKFINFLMEPEIIAGVTNQVRYANANLSANEFVDKSVLENAGIYPTKAMSEKNFILPPYPQKVDRQALRMWSRIKTGR
ncbi:polyamine ABC transporter substrate-binding protein [Pseudomonadales bacterium]|nr:polyamine ABC transporter substrate-binding protein [Pseudomonadales bacterium]MDA9366667.1 polyamine ABC transporter substrate-binding protein [Pseudomonadales bacterium]MDB4151702.1 polyamine ABC transporter substrate-binding protein [Pseudomonadales bacterium]MDB9868818.1 polyamine ABC transporter substrate-binding protein [Pseudomonadales bacterium]